MNPRDERIDHINRRAWEDPDSVREYARLAGWTDPGERAAVDWVRDEAADRPILDIGVGAGRTTPLLREVSDDYRAVDYAPAMVEAARHAHPDVEFRQMDARDLGAFGDDTFGLVVFSFNGIDAIPPGDGRTAALAEIHRVLQPGGLAIVSAHNRHGPGHGERLRTELLPTWTSNPIRLAGRTAKRLAWVGHAAFNRLRNRRFDEVGTHRSLRNAGAQHFGVLIVYTSLTRQLEEFAEAGFEVEQIFTDLDDRPVDLTGDQSDHPEHPDVFWFHYVVRKPVEA